RYRAAAEAQLLILVPSVDSGFAGVAQSALDALGVVDREERERRAAEAEEAMPLARLDRDRIERLERRWRAALDLDRAIAGEHHDHLVAVVAVELDGVAGGEAHRVGLDPGAAALFVDELADGCAVWHPALGNLLEFQHPRLCHHQPPLRSGGSDHSQAAPRTPLESPHRGGANRVVTLSEKT